MNDKELLEFAAKAIKKSLIYNETFGCFSLYDGQTELHLYWDPLLCGDNSLDLAAALTMNVDILENMTRVTVPQYGVMVVEHADKSPRNPFAKIIATKRAITRAAAEIGKSL